MTENYDMKKVHEANLKILKEIDRICRKYKIRYALDAGTLIGAVRHSGFIPWDDDADVVFLRSQYEAFVKVAKRELPETMELLFPDSYRDGKAFFDFTPRIIYKNSRCHADSPEMAFYGGKLNHLWVDLFVLDRLPDGKAGSFLAKFMQKAVYGFAMAHRDRLDFSKYSAADRVRVGILTAVGKLIPMRLLFRLQRCLAMKDQKKNTKRWYYSNYQPDYLYVTLDGKWCESAVDLPFEDTMLMAPAGYEHVLRCIYGDYMTLPPEEKRVPAHSTIEIEISDSEVERQEEH